MTVIVIKEYISTLAIKLVSSTIKKKLETNYIIEGEAVIWLENDQGVIVKSNMAKDDCFTVRPPKKHRVIAITDIILQEVSTPEVDDVIRIEDDSDRGNGKIASEHSE